METPHRRREKAVHRRGEKTAGDAHEGASRLQVPAAAETQDPEEGGVPLLDTLPQRAYGRFESW